LKSRCFAIIMSMLFPSGTFHSDPQMESRDMVADWGDRFKFPRENEEDMQSITRLAIDGIPLDMTKVIPPKSIPHYLPKDPICINKAIFCTLITAICGISRFLWNSNAPCLRLCDFDDDGAFDPSEPYPAPYPTTTLPPSARPIADLRGFIDEEDLNINRQVDRRVISTKTQPLELDSRISQTNRAVRTSRSVDPSESYADVQQQRSARILTDNITAPVEQDNMPDPQDLFSIKDMIQYLQKNTYASVLTENDKVFTFFQVYVSAFASHNRLTFNDRVAKSRSVTQPSAINRSLHSMLTRGINF
jgi:hypothetical protein